MWNLVSDHVVDPGKYWVNGELRKGHESLAKVDQHVVIRGDKPGETN